ncbi:threonine--tRNA ligase [Candidatus Dojkabacteria bacterium]|uniref:Threonine--tRNA ligase n=1 Tax=Candidatus Dojkabacteria bacterium TaxID=2099670 RepID=A0A955L1M0_9BACT|nr:threonine--tRNA ligase [Candidatus Dojkabacteria bacterium]
MKNNDDYENSNLYKIRHTCEHVFNQAVEELYLGKVMRAMGPPIENGWYNDSRWDIEISEQDFPKIEKRMQKIIKANLPLIRKDISADEAKKMFGHNPFKMEFIDEYVKEGKDLTVYYTGDPEAEAGSYKRKVAGDAAADLPGDAVFVDLCKGPHASSTSEIKAYKLLSIAGAYWRGDEKNEMLKRVYGTAFESKEELDEYINMIEEAKKRDHRKLAKDLDLIVFSELVGAGLPMYTPRGSILRNAVYNFSRELNAKIGYHEVNTPNFNRAELFKISGHYDKYKDDMFKVISNYSEEEMYYKPMNCPQHTQLYASQMRSYKDLPYRVADFSNLARDERPGELHGILRSRVFTQDDGHAFVRPDQIADEFKNVQSAINEALDVYGLNYYIRLSLRDPEEKEKYLGSDEVWEKAEAKLKELVKDLDVEYFEAPGEAAIYGPKMDFIAKDSLGREWQISTIQIDMNMPHRFGLKFIDQDGSEQEPVMIHRAIVGSERFIGIIIEHFAGAFPVWMSPDQVTVLPVSEKHAEYADSINKQLEEAGIRILRAEVNETLGNKIRKAQAMKVPYMLVVGDKEKDKKTVNVRLRSGEELGEMPLEVLIERVKGKIESKSLDL